MNNNNKTQVVLFWEICGYLLKTTKMSKAVSPKFLVSPRVYSFDKSIKPYPSHPTTVGKVIFSRSAEQLERKHDLLFLEGQTSKAGLGLWALRSSPRRREVSGTKAYPSSTNGTQRSSLEL